MSWAQVLNVRWLENYHDVKKMADLPPPPPSSDLPDVAVVTIVHKVKSKLGYTEINTPFPGFENDKVNTIIMITST